MENCHSYNYQIQGWDSDYQNLKRYRYIRNQIVHDNWASEDSLCEINDVHWLNEFHQRILNQTDPLAQYRKLVQRMRQQSRKTGAKKQVTSETATNHQVTDKIREDSVGEDFGTLPLIGSYGIDYLIGEKPYLGKGFGKMIIRYLVDKIFSFPEAQRVTADIDENNTISKKSLLSCGFHLLEDERSRYIIKHEEKLMEIKKA